MGKNYVSHFVLFFVFFTSLIFGHNTYKGKVLDESSNLPLTEATVLIKGTSEGTYTDEWGNFTLNTEYASGVLIISYVGYETKEIEFTSHTEFLVISLKPDIIELNSVLISANELTPMVSIAKVDVNLRTINNAQNALRIVPGLFIAQHAGGGKSEQIFLRGFDADHGTDVNLSVDGIPVNMVSQAHGQGYADLHGLIPELIREVDFGKGPYYADKGNFATAGYVEFKTFDKAPSDMIKLEAGQFNTLRIMGLYNLLGEKNSQNGKNAYVAMEYFMTDGPFDYPQNLNRINLFAKYSQIVDQNNKFSITASLFNSKWDQSGQIPESAVEDGIIDRWGSLDPTEGGFTTRNNLSLSSLHQLKDEGTFKNLLYYTKYTFDLFSNFTFYLNDRINGDQIQQKEERNLYGYKGSYIKNYYLKNDSQIKMEIGGGFRYDQIHDSQLLNTKERYTILGVSNFGDIYEFNTNLFGQASWMKKKWMVNVGLRLDAFKFEYIDKTTVSYQPQEDYQNIFSPKINVSYNFSNFLQVYAKLGKGFHSNDAKIAVQNDALTLPAAYGADMGLNWKPIPELFINAAAWYMMLEEELVWSGDAGTWEPSGRTQRLGLDLSLRWQIMKRIYFDTDLNFSDARFMDEPDGMNYVPLAPVITSTGGLKYVQEKGWSAALRYRYMSDRPADESNSVTAYGYMVFDFNLNYAYRKWVFGVSVENLFNTEWNEAQFAGDYRVSPTADAEYGLTFTPGTPFYFKSSVIFNI